MSAHDSAINPSSQEMQEAEFGEHFDYRAGSPHLKHFRLQESLLETLGEVVRRTRARGLPPTLLEVGAGHGGYTEAFLAAGCQVTATEMSRPSLQRLHHRFGLNPGFSAVFDEDGSLRVLGADRFSLIVCISVLHHIPDYVSFVRRAVHEHLAVGGTFVSVQDPLWYPRVRPTIRYLDRTAYFSWRLTQGSYRVGAKTLLRRLRGVYDPGLPNDMVEYHVVRSGVDERAVISVLDGMFERTSLLPYWSAQAAPWQRLGERLNLKNTFALEAEGYRG